MAYFSQAEWDRVKKAFTAFWNHQLERPLVVAYGNSDGSKYFPPLHSPYDPFMSEEELIEHAVCHVENTICYGDAFPVFWPNFGPGIVSAMAGLCSLHSAGGTIWYEPQQVRSLAQTHITADFDNIWYNKLYRVTELAIERFGSKVLVAYSDLGGNLDLLSAFRKPEHLLLDMVDNPAEVVRLRDEFHTAWWEYFETFSEMIGKQNHGFAPWSLTWSDRPTYILQCDFAAMLSPTLFREFAVPEIKASCRKMQHSFFHVDGPAMANHIDYLLAIDELKGIQWQPGAESPPGNTWSELVELILKSGKLLQLITNRQQTIDAISRYGRKNIMYYMTESLTPHEANEFFKKIDVA